MLRYWRRVIARAWKDTRSFLEHKYKKTVQGTFAVLISVFGFGLYRGIKEAVGKFEWWVFVTGAGLCIFILVFLWNLIAAPARMDAEARKAAEEEEAKRRQEAERREAELNARLSKLQETLDEMNAKPSLRGVDAERRRLAEQGIARLSPAEEAAIREILVRGLVTDSQLAECLGPRVAIDADPDRLAHRTNFITRTHRGEWFINPAFKEHLQDILGATPH